MTTKISREDIALYVMGAYDGDIAALEAQLADDAAARTMLAEEAELELALRDAASAGTFCPNCDDLIADTTEPTRCVECGAAVKPGGYVVERVIVANAHGRMYVARDADGTRVALKELAFVQSPSTETIAAFEREAKFLRALEHAAIPRFLAAFEEGSGVHTRYYLAQELVDGTALDARLDDHFYSEAEIIEIARQVLGVLAYLQTLSPMVIHRDIKPANLLRRPDGKIAVVDFGAAHVQGTTAGSTSIGTFGYMPLEQLAGQVDATTDTYALGASLVHLLTRREPWRVFGAATFEALNVTPALQRFLAKCVAPEPKDRFANATAALAALDALGTEVIPIARKRRIPFGVWKVGIGILAAALTLGGAGVAGYFLRGDVVAHDDDEDEDEDGDGDEDEDDKDEKRTYTHEELRERIEKLRARADELRTRFDATSTNEKADIEARLKDSLVLYNIEKDRTVTKPEPEPPPIPRFSSPQIVELDFKGAPLPSVLRTIGAACGVNVIVPAYLKASVTVKVTGTPCSQIFEVILESHGFDYAFDPVANLVRVAPRNELEREREAAPERAEVRKDRGLTDDVLPEGPRLDLDFRDAQLRSVLDILVAAGKVNLVMPEYLKGQVTIIAKQVSWDAALKSVLASQGMWLRYRPDGRILRVAPRNELDREDEAAPEK